MIELKWRRRISWELCCYCANESQIDTDHEMIFFVFVRLEARRKTQAECRGHFKLGLIRFARDVSWDNAILRKLTCSGFRTRQRYKIVSLCHLGFVSQCRVGSKAVSIYHCSTHPSEQNLRWWENTKTSLISYWSRLIYWGWWYCCVNEPQLRLKEIIVNSRNF